jgi:tetratricopeptide (TPR) repeat protein
MAKKTYANEDAIRLYSEALDIISEEDDRRFDLLSARVSLNDLMGNREDQLMDIESMIEIAEKENNKQKMADALIEMASFYVEFDPGKARDPSEKALKISHSMDDFSREGNACFLLSQHFRMVNDLSNSRDYLDQAISITRKEGLTSQLVEYLSYLSKISHLYEEKEIVLNAANEALFLSKTINDKRLLMVANLAVAIVTAQLMKDYIQAVEFAKESLQFAEEISDVTGELSVLNFLGLIYHELGNLEKAEPYFLRMLEPSLLFTGHYTIYGLFNLNNLYVSMGEYEKSYLIVEKMLNLARPTDNDYMITEILFLCALACYQLGDYKNAIKYHEEVWLNIQDSSVEGEKARVISMFGILTAATDDHKSAYKYIEKGQRICEGLLDDKAYKAHVFRNSAQVARMIGNTSEIKDGLEKVKRAIDLLQEIQTNDGWPYFVRAGLHLLLVNEDSNHAKEALNSLEIAFDWRKKYPVGWWSEWTNEMIFLLASNVYRANNLILKADEYLQKAYDRVMLVAGKIQDDELRRSFLENVKDNREILQEAKARGITFE